MLFTWHRYFSHPIFISQQSEIFLCLFFVNLFVFVIHRYFFYSHSIVKFGHHSVWNSIIFQMNTACNVKKSTYKFKSTWLCGSSVLPFVRSFALSPLDGASVRKAHCEQASTAVREAHCAQATQGLTLTFKSTCPIGQQAWENYLPPFLTSCPIHGAAAERENMEGGSICNVVMGIGMNISYQPVALIVFIASWSQKSQNNRTGTVFIIVHNQILSYTVIRDNTAGHVSNQVYLVTTHRLLIYFISSGVTEEIL